MAIDGQATQRAPTGPMSLWLPLLAALPLALCLFALALPMLGYGAASFSRTLFLSAFLVWVIPLTWLQRRWWRQGLPIAPLALRLLVCTFTMALISRALALLILRVTHADTSGAIDFSFMLRGIEGPWLALIAYGAIHAVAIHAAELQHTRTQHAEAVALAREAELNALRLQLQPHFLFNTLNGISTLIGEQRGADAQRMLAKLAELLRATLQTPTEHESSLAEEVALAEAYLAIEQSRLGARVQLSWQIGPGLLSAQLPRLLLQPLLENAIRHGIAPRQAPGSLRIRIERDETQLRIHLDNDLPDLMPTRDGASVDPIGLVNIRRRLEALYPNAHEFSAEVGNDGRFQVRILLPLRAAT